MPGCVLRIESKSVKVEALVKAFGVNPMAVYRKDQPRVPGSGVLSRRSGFNVDISRADDLQAQARDAVRFLKRHVAQLRRLRRCKALGAMTLDFGLYDRASEQAPWPSYRVPADLVALAGKNGIGIDMSFYGSTSNGTG